MKENFFSELFFSSKRFMSKLQPRLDDLENQISSIGEGDNKIIEINKKNLEVNLETMLKNRMLSIRHEKVNATFTHSNKFFAIFVPGNLLF